MHDVESMRNEINNYIKLNYLLNLKHLNLRYNKTLLVKLPSLWFFSRKQILIVYIDYFFGNFAN